MKPPVPRAMFFYDGFNLYHSVDRVQKLEPARSVKWLDLTALSIAHLSAIGPTEVLAGVHYFTAFRELFPTKRLVFCFPFDRKNRQLAQLAPGSFVLGRESYARHQFPEAVRLPSGKFVVRPHAWAPLAAPPASTPPPASAP
jgi:hypothetical protein